MKRLIFLMIFMLLVQTGSAQAISVQTGQETIDIVIEGGKSQTLFLILNVDGGENVTSAGDISSWVRFGTNNEKSITFPASGTQNLRLNISVPPSQAVGDYKGEIRSGATVLSTFTVTVTLQTDEIKTLQTLSDIDQKIADLESRLDSSIKGKIGDAMDKIRSEIDSMETELSSSIKAVQDYQGEIDALKSERSVLEDRVDSLNSAISSLEAQRSTLEDDNQNLKITGNLLRQESPALFIIGLLIGIGGMYLFYRKADKYFYRKPKKFLGR